MDFQTVLQGIPRVFAGPSSLRSSRLRQMGTTLLKNPDSNRCEIQD